jgi:CHAD domain-containing protein
VALLQGEDLPQPLKDLTHTDLIEHCRIHTDRSIHYLRTPGDAFVQVQVDRSEVTVGETTVSVPEIACLLKAGPFSELQALARRLVSESGLILCPCSGLETGLGLARHEPPWKTAERVRLNSDNTAEDALDAMLRAGLRQLRRNEHCVLDRAHAEGVHQMRVALRRLRTAFQCCRHLIPEQEYAAWSGRMREMQAVLGRARDLDVYRDTTLHSVCRGPDEDAGWDGLTELALQESDTARGEVERMLRSPTYALFQLEFTDWIERRGWREQELSERSARLFGPATDLAALNLEKRMRQVRRHGRTSRLRTPEKRHRFRISVKKLRYAADFVRDLYPKSEIRPLGRTAAKLQDLLGAEHDALVAEQLSRELADRAGLENRDLVFYSAGVVTGCQRQTVQGRGTEARRLWKRLARLKRFW